MNAEKSLREHDSGWDVFLKGKKEFSLKYLKSDPPFYLYVPTEIGCDQKTLEFILKSSVRSPDVNIVYRNPKYGSVVEDQYFIGSFENGEARLRDFRPQLKKTVFSKFKMAVLRLLQ